MALELQGKLKSELDSLSKSPGTRLPLDDAILDALPKGTIAQSWHSHGRSPWAFTAKIVATDSNGKPTPFFIKYVAGELGKRQLEGEFTGMRELHNAAPNFVVKPIGWGKLKTAVSPLIPETYFLIVEFREFRPRQSGLPDHVKLGARLAAMHRNSVSPNGKFGFPVQTYDGARIQSIGWDEKWTSFFSKLLAEAYRQDVESNGVWPQLDQMYQRVQSRLIPRLIGALESEGRSVTPRLIHGDLWEGNIGVEDGTGDPWIFDCAAYYAHNEMELGIWCAERHELRRGHFRLEYRKHYAESEPKEEWEDRLRLYSAKTNFMYSAITQKRDSRQLVYDDFVYLINKYVDEDEGVVLVE